MDYRTESFVPFVEIDLGDIFFLVRPKEYRQFLVARKLQVLCGIQRQYSDYLAGKRVNCPFQSLACPRPCWTKQVVT